MKRFSMTLFAIGIIAYGVGLFRIGAFNGLSLFGVLLVVCAILLFYSADRRSRR